MGINKILYCDLDGTLIEKNLESRFIAYLLKERRFSICHYLLAAVSLPLNKVRQACFRPCLIKSWTAFRKENEKKDLIADFLSKEVGKIEFVPNVLEFVRSFDGRKILLTGSDEDLVIAFLKQTGNENLFDGVCGSKTAENGFYVVTHPFGYGKRPFLDETAFCVGIGNEYADRFFLEKCNEAYVSLPDKKLHDTAVKRDWREL